MSSPGEFSLDELDLGVGLVSCLMVTQASRWRDGDPAGVRAFRAQGYSRKELVIVTSDPCEEMDQAGFDINVRPQGLTLGQLRQEALDLASGEFVATWDDDDDSHPDRILAQLQALTALPTADACVLLRVVIRDLINDRLFMGPRHSWEPTMLARRESMPAYPPHLQRGEDTAVIAQLRQLVILDRPELFTHVVHAGSLVGARFLKEWASAAKEQYGQEPVDLRSIPGGRS